MSYIFILPETSAAPEKLVDSPAARQWWERFTELRRTEAKDLFELAALAAKENRPALAFELVRETVREDPNYQRGRRFPANNCTKASGFQPKPRGV